MARLLINRVNYLLQENAQQLYCSPEPILPFRKQFRNFVKGINSAEIIKAVRNGIKGDNELIYFGFTNPNNEQTIAIDGFDYDFSKYEREFVKERLISFFKTRQFLIRPFATGIDFSVLQKRSQYDQTWSLYQKLDFVIKPKRREICFNITSENTLISDNPIAVSKGEQITVIDTTSGDLRSLNSLGDPLADEYRIVANHRRRTEIGISSEAPEKFSYKKRYFDLNSFYKNVLSEVTDECFKIEAGGFKNVDIKDYQKVNHSENLMVFGKNQTDVNPISGMRDFGPYKPAPNVTNNKFIFIYENRDDANKLYFNFKNGLKHFPGLWSYVGIPVTLERDISLKYENSKTLKGEFDQFLLDKLAAESYENYFVIVIGDFNRQESDEEQSDLYYHIKSSLLKKGIPSQFIGYKGVRGGSFHYYLPNIAVAILAKMGGIPWKLKGKTTDELVIGFNQKKIADSRFIGSAVFFSNEGELNGVVGYPESDSETALLAHLRNSIESYINHKSKAPERLIIHYYKPYSDNERWQTENLIQNELRLNIPFAVVEVNDSKTQIDLCFDQDSDFGMPESGTYIKVGRDEYLLFNNTRYNANTVRSVLDELPIKIRIHFADTGGFSHKELISQIYEFSRLYWKGLKQRSQPATTIYSKLIADFKAHFEEAMPDNSIVNDTPWFL